MTNNKIITLLAILSIPLSNFLFSADVATNASEINASAPEQVAVIRMQASLKGCVGLASTCDRRT